MARMSSSSGGWDAHLKRRIALMVDARMTPDQIGLRVADVAQANLQALINRGSASDTYDTIVDGVEGADESTVNLNGGEIRYDFHSLREAALFALQYCRDYSHHGDTGAYAAAWFAVVDGVPWGEALEEIPGNAQQVIIVNPAPFARRLEIGKPGRNDPSLKISQEASQATAAQFPSLRVVATFVSIPSGGAASADWPVPYQLKRRGGTMTYPAVAISQK